MARKSPKSGKPTHPSEPSAPAADATPMTYAQAGVDIHAGDEMVHRIERHMRRTYGPRVVGRHGAFAGLLRLDYNEKLFARNYREPVLAACADGVGSKLKLALQCDRIGGLGQDLVAMNVNDLIVQGAEPLFFLDYIGTHKLDPQRMTQLVAGIADACVKSDCALLGGETAELPDLYTQGEFDLAGFAVGVCELSRLIDGSRIQRGDVVLGLASEGVHSNGFTLVRAILERAKLDPTKVYPEADPDRTLAEALLRPTRLYARAITSLLRAYKRPMVTGMAHITGGGLAGNLRRALPKGLDASLSRKAWEVPPIFGFLQQQGGVSDQEMDRVFNQGIGFCLVVRPSAAAGVVKRLSRGGETVYRLGQIIKGSGRVRLRK